MYNNFKSNNLYSNIFQTSNIYKIKLIDLKSFKIAIYKFIIIETN